MRIAYHPRDDATPEAELNVLASVYRFILDCYAKRIAGKPDSCNDAAIVGNTKGVGHVKQGPDRPSEAVVTHSERAPPA
jgi:hypothetical protein